MLHISKNPIWTQNSKISFKNQQTLMLHDFLILEFFRGISGPIYIKKTTFIQTVIGIIIESGYVFCDMHEDFQDLWVDLELEAGLGNHCL